MPSPESRIQNLASRLGIGNLFKQRRLTCEEYLRLQMEKGRPVLTGDAQDPLKCLDGIKPSKLSLTSESGTEADIRRRLMEEMANAQELESPK